MDRARVPIQRKCDQRWSDLRGVGSRKRHCGVCDSDVVNLSSMTADAADDFLARVETPICLAYRYSEDGQISFASEPVPAARLFRRAPTGLAAAAALSMAACDGGPGTSEHPNTEIGASEQAAVEPSSPDLPAEHAAQPDEDAAVESASTAMSCTMLRQLYALGGYGTEPPDRCLDEESGELVPTRP